MRFVPNYDFQIIKESEFNVEIKSVERIIEQHKNVGEFIAFDNSKIYYEYFLAENAKANLVIVHGLSEFTRKFYEFTYYMLNQGYNVFIHDQRCHGLSSRLGKTNDILHVDSFNDYAKDLEQFIKEIVIPTQNIPIYLYAHSMGGSIAALYLAKNSQKIEKAVFAAPMFQPIVKNVSDFLARVSVATGNFFIGSKKRFFLSHDFDPDVKYDDKHGSSKVRFEYNMSLRKSNKKYQSSPMSFGWVHNSLIIKDTILKDSFIKKISTPILILSAEKDTVVKNSAQKVFASKYKKCKLIEIKDETHALLASNSERLENMIKMVLDFYSN